MGIHVGLIPPAIPWPEQEKIKIEGKIWFKARSSLTMGANIFIMTVENPENTCRRTKNFNFAGKTEEVINGSQKC
jgi:hypothetical protein